MSRHRFLQGVTCSNVYGARRAADLVSGRRGVTFEEIFSQSRRKRIAHARFEVWHLMRKSGFSLTEIGEVFDRDHTSILHGLRRVEELGLTA